MGDTVVPGILEAIEKRERLNTATSLQISNLRKGGKDKCCFGDGTKTIPGRLSGNAKTVMDEVEEGAIVRILQYVCNADSESDSSHLSVFRLEVVSKTRPKEPLKGAIENLGAQESGRGQANGTPRQVKKENVGPYKTPAAKAAEKFAGPTPPSTGRKGPQPIEALNPYNNNWTIKARVASKGPLRTLSKNGPSYSVFSVTLVDAQGTEIEGTFWREVAEQWFDKLQEGKVYLISKGRVKPANRSFSTARNDYTIDFSNDTLIEEADDVDPEKMKARLSYSRLDHLGSFLGRKALTDVIAIVKDAQDLGSVKRKSDGTDLPRRDITLVDQSAKMVRLTIWGAAAENEGAEIAGKAADHPVLSVSGVRVGDYDGISLSSVQRSVVVLDPACKETEALKAWWAEGGCNATFTHAGEGLQLAKRPGGNPDDRTWLQSIVKDKLQLPPPDAKPEYFNVTACCMAIDPQQTPFFYQGDPATGKKVVHRNGEWRTANEDALCEGMQWRYFVRAKLMDCTEECDVLLSNDQAEKLLKLKGDELHEIRESNPNEFEAVLLEAQFTEWTLTIKSNTSSYKDDLRQRLQVAGKMAAVDFATESKLLISKIKALA